MTTDRYIGLHVPQYTDKTLVVPADYAYWEVLLNDGTIQRETDGIMYNNIDRANMQSFRIVHAGEIVIEIRPSAEKGSTGHDLVYRKRTQMVAGTGRRVLHVLGFAPMGPVWVLNLEDGLWGSFPAFDPTDATLAPPMPLPGEPTQMIPPKALITP